MTGKTITRGAARITMLTTLATAVAAIALAAPAHADVRDGVNAWSRGDYAAAVQQWQGPAARGDADAQFNLGQAAKLGRGMPRDMAKAEDWFHKAAQQGHARAADNYGVLLFQTGRQTQALPWIQASADRGEPRAMYILGIAAFNGDFQPKDWVRAYALMTRAAGAGLPQAMDSLKAMNEAIPLEQRQQGAAMASELETRTSDTRSRELASAELGVGGAPLPAPAAAQVATVAPVHPPATPLLPVPLPPSQPAGSGPVMAGASYADPVVVPRAQVAARPESSRAPVAPPPAPRPAPLAAAPAKAPAKPAGGAYRVQLGAFAQKGNADAQWARLRTRAELAGHPRIDLAQGGVTRLLAGGFASPAEAARACAALKSAGFDCIPARP